MAILAPAGALAQSHEGHNHEEVAAQRDDHDGHGSEAAMSEDDWLKQTDDEHGEHEGHDDHADEGHGDHDDHDKVAEAHTDDDGHDHGNQPAMSEDDWLKQPTDDHHGSGGDHDGHNHN